jgi:ATP-binding cassette subfamily B protein
MHAASKRNQEAMGALSTVMTETFRGVASIRLHAARSAFLERIDNANHEVYESSRRLALLQTTVIPMAGLMVNFAQAIVLLYGGAQVIAGNLQAGDIMVFNVYMASLAFPLAFSGGVVALIERARSAHARIAEIFDFPKETAHDGVLGAGVSLPPRASHGLALPPHTQTLLQVSSLTREFKSENANFKIDDISFSLQPGRAVGICGAVGAGKSLLFDLILRFEEPPPASIFFQSKDVLTWQPAVLRSHIACALQNARLFSDSIRTNLAFGLARAISDDEMYSALERACIADEVRSFPDGLDTVTGEKGMRLSGGQRQRLALARLFLRSPELLLLDDVFSAVDQKTEKRLIDETMALRKTALISSHRHSVLERCDEVFFLHAGRLLDRGRYEDLAARHQTLLSALEREGSDD